MLHLQQFSATPPPTPSSETPAAPLAAQLSVSLPLVTQSHSLSLSLASRRSISRSPATALSPARWPPLSLPFASRRSLSGLSSLLVAALRPLPLSLLFALSLRNL
ncbi:hypothetical protein FH972_027241 [Carpinus fangiana]|uniref:Uncharacterized protein n=1 Tax=Carpinus fangiana TaxID=176857 RepID=A0A5N6L6E8_9ROSI|nr:hypothetical protein FH972_027241 [Carpinus fangiana]